MNNNTNNNSSSLNVQSGNGSDTGGNSDALGTGLPDPIRRNRILRKWFVIISFFLISVFVLIASFALLYLGKYSESMIGIISFILGAWMPHPYSQLSTKDKKVASYSPLWNHSPTSSPEHYTQYHSSV